MIERFRIIWWYLTDWWDGKPLGGLRSPKWSMVRREFLLKNPVCAVCGRKSGLLKPNNVHHIIPVSWDKSLELSENNFITLCREDHYLFGHYMDWKSFNKDVRIDSEIWKQRIQNKPRKEVAGSYQKKLKEE